MHTRPNLTDPEIASPPPWDDLATVLKHAEQAQADRDTARAYTFYVRATELDSNNAAAWSGRAVTTQDIDDEIVSWGYALALAPENIQARIRLEQAVADKIEESTIADAAQLFALARDLAEAGQKDYAYRLMVRATTVDDTHADFWIWRAGLTSDVKEMISSLNQALAMSPDNVQAQVGLKWALAQQTKNAPPISSSAADEAQQFFLEGNHAYKSGDFGLAHDLFKHATELDQRNAKAWFWRGVSVEESDVDEALTCMEQVLALDPTHEPAKEKRSWLRVRKLREPTTPNSTRAPETRAYVPGAPSVAHQTNRARWILLLAAIGVLIFILLLAIRPI